MIVRRSKYKDQLRGLLLSLCGCLLLALFSPALAADTFPLYPCIQKNIRFWEAIYSRYTTRQGVLHDAADLGRIYGVIELVDWKLPGATVINEERVRQEKERIQDMLNALAAGQPPQTAEARRMASLFPSPQHSALFHEAQENIRLQLGQKDRFLEGVIRSGKYLADFRRILAANGLPRELAYLPHVESSFNLKAASKAGAAGLWQFTRSTGSEYLVINACVDERYDPYLATEGAARLLKKNYDALGTWPLALTAYNYGRAGMLRAVRDQGSYERIFTSYNQGSFKFAARNFYSEFLAAMRVANQLERQAPLRLDQPEPTTTFRLQQATPLVRLQSLVGLSHEQFIRLNPALQKPVIEGKKTVPQGYLVRKPASRSIRSMTSTQKLPHQKTAIKRPSQTARPSCPSPPMTAKNAYNDCGWTPNHQIMR